MLSLLYVGFVSANSLRGFLKTLSKFVAFASSASSSASSASSSAAGSRGKPGGDHALMVLLLAMLTGTYLLTSTVLLRAKLPEHARGNATAPSAPHPWLEGFTHGETHTTAISNMHHLRIPHYWQGDTGGLKGRISTYLFAINFG